jgi:two-component system, sensor histidine kinase
MPRRIERGDFHDNRRTTNSNEELAPRLDAKMTVCQGWSEEPLRNCGPPNPLPAPERLRILIIEDNFDYADTLRHLLGLYGHHADVATDGPSGLRLASSGRYDSILCDIGLPGMDGYEVARRLRSEPATSGVAIIAVTAYGSAEAKRQCFAAGFDAHLLKPASIAEIMSSLGIHIPVTTA